MNVRSALSGGLDDAARWYLWTLMGGLLAQGLGSLVLRLAPELDARSPYLVSGVLGIDIWHALIHIVWGAAGLLLLARLGRRIAGRLALVFGLFYTALGLLGVLVHHPLGLKLDLFENGFHLVAGPLALLAAAVLLGRPVAAHAAGR
jgi:hypothetical protein